MAFFQLFHQQSKFANRKSTSISKAEWPESWTTTYYKGYERFPVIALPAAHTFDSTLIAAIEKRASARQYKNNLSVEQLSTALYFTSGEIDADALYGRGRRAAASAGARYPIETYIMLFKPVGHLSTGVYHYNVFNHTVSRLLETEFTEDTLQTLFNYKETTSATGVCIYTAIFSRENQKYRERGYRHALLEAGGIVEQWYLLASALNFGCVAMSGYQDTQIESLLDIDGVTESPVHCVVFG